MRKRTRRRIWLPRPPVGLRPMLTRQQCIDLSIVHHVNLDTVANGAGDEDLLWDMVECVLLWSRVADVTGQHVDAMRAQLEMVTRIAERFGRTGRVGFSGPEYQLAKQGVAVMDDLAHTAEQAVASAACAWAESQVMATAARVGLMQHQAAQQASATTAAPHGAA